MKRAAIYLRVSRQDQTTANQEHELRRAAERAGWQVTKVYRDHGTSGAKGRNGKPAFEALCRDATKRQFDVVMAWNVATSLEKIIGGAALALVEPWFRRVTQTLRPADAVDARAPSRRVEPHP